MIEPKADAKAIFLEALDFTAVDGLNGFLDRACAADAPLRARVEELLRAHREAGGFLGGAEKLPPTVDQAVSEGPGTVIGPYKLLEQIGEGGFGVVFLAEQSQPVRRKVALKVLKPGMDTRQVVARFEAERQALALMDHPNIAKVFDGGATPSGRPYFVMELVKGTPITRYCDDHRLTPRDRLSLFVQVCQAVQHAHQKGVIHRDLKPTNVLVALYDGRPVPKVIDFGVAKAAGVPLTDKTLVTGLGAVVGTPEYMSPEQAELNNTDIDTRSDVYSLGVVLYELLAGSPPFTKKDLETAGVLEMLRVIREQEPSKPSTKLSTAEGLPTLAANRGMEPGKLTKLVRGELDWIVMKALEKDRNRRYETANGVAMDVQRYLADEPVQACPPSAGYRLRKFARRNKGGLAVAAMVLFFVVLLGSGVGWIVRDRAAQRAVVEPEVMHALDEADQWQAHEKWPEALSAVKRAEGLLATIGNYKLRERVRQRRQELEMVLALEETTLLLADSKSEVADFGKTDRAYANVFAGYDIDVTSLPVEDAASRIRARAGVAIALVTAIDDWASVRTRRKDRAGAQALLAVAQAADPDPWRWQVREAQRQNDGDRLIKLAALPEYQRQPPISIRMLAIALFVRGRDATAINILREAQRLYPGDFWINRYLCVYLHRMGTASPFMHEAISYSMAALALRPNSPSCHYSVGVVLWDLEGKPHEAIEFFRRAAELDPTSLYAHHYMGSALCMLGKQDEAITWLRKAVNLDPEYAEARYDLGLAYQLQGNDADAIACYRKVLKLNAQYVSAHTNLAILLRRRGQLDDAIAHCRQAINIDPNEVLSYLTLGHVFYDQRKWDDAIDSFSQMVAIDPIAVELGRGSSPIAQVYATAYRMLGAALDKRNRLEEAIASYRKCIEIDSNDADGYCGLGATLGKTNQLTDAICCFQRAIEINPKHASAHFNMGLAKLRQGKPVEAEAAFHKSIEINPEDAGAHCELGGMFLDQGKLGDAITHYLLAVKFDRRLRNAHYGLGLTYARQREFNEAITWHRKATEIDLNYTDGHYALGLDWMALEKPDEAIICFRKVIKLDPKYVSAHMSLVYALLDRGKTEEAAAASREAIGLIDVPPKSTRDNRTVSNALQAFGYALYLVGAWRESIETEDQSCKLQAGGTGDGAQWIVMSLAHARLAAQPGLPEKERKHHEEEASRLYVLADKQIDGWWRVRPDHAAGKKVWDFREEARKLMSVNVKKK